MDAVSFTLFSPRYLTSTLYIYPGGYCRFQVTGIFEWGQKSKPNIWPFVQYFICRTVQLGYEGSTTNLRILLSTPKNSLLKSSHPRKVRARFSYLKKIPESKILNPQKSFDHPRLLKSRVPTVVIYIFLQAAGNQTKGSETKSSCHLPEQDGTTNTFV